MISIASYSMNLLPLRVGWKSWPCGQDVVSVWNYFLWLPLKPQCHSLVALCVCVCSGSMYTCVRTCTYWVLLSCVYTVLFYYIVDWKSFSGDRLWSKLPTSLKPRLWLYPLYIPSLFTPSYPVYPVAKKPGCEDSSPPPSFSLPLSACHGSTQSANKWTLNSLT